MENEYRSVRSIPNNRVFRRSERPSNIKMVNSRYVPSSYQTYDDSHSRLRTTPGYGSTSHTYTK